MLGSDEQWLLLGGGGVRGCSSTHRQRLMLRGGGAAGGGGGGGKSAGSGPAEVVKQSNHQPTNQPTNKPAHLPPHTPYSCVAGVPFSPAVAESTASVLSSIARPTRYMPGSCSTASFMTWKRGRGGRARGEEPGGQIKNVCLPDRAAPVLPAAGLCRAGYLGRSP